MRLVKTVKYSHFFLGYSQLDNSECIQYEEKKWLNLREAKHECLEDPDCRMFFHRCGNTDFKVCSKDSQIQQSTCGSITYVKGKNDCITAFPRLMSLPHLR